MSDFTPVRMFPVGMALGILLASSFVLCVIFGLLFPNATMYQVWLPLLPGVTWMSWPSAFLGAGVQLLFAQDEGMTNR